MINNFLNKVQNEYVNVYNVKYSKRIVDLANILIIDGNLVKNRFGKKYYCKDDNIDEETQYNFEIKNNVAIQVGNRIDIYFDELHKSHLLNDHIIKEYVELGRIIIH